MEALFYLPLIISDIKSIADDITNSIILSEFDSLLWQGNMQVLEKYQTYLNIAFNDYNALSDIEKKNYAMTEFAKGIESLKNVNEVKELFDESVKKGKNYSSGKGNGYSDSRNESSSGGGKGSGGGGTSIVIGGGIVTTEFTPVRTPSETIQPPIWFTGAASGNKKKDDSAGSSKLLELLKTSSALDNDRKLIEGAIGKLLSGLELGNTANIEAQALAIQSKIK